MANLAINDYTAGSALVGTEIFEGVLSPYLAGDDRKWTAAQIKTWCSASPALVTPNLGTPSAGTLTNATDLPIATGVSGLGSGVADFLGTPSSANLIAAVTGETGTGALVFADTPTLVTPALGAATATSIVASGLLQAGTTLGISTDVLLVRDNAAELGLRNGTTAQAFNVYNTWATGGNHERLVIKGVGATGLQIVLEKLGTGGNRNLLINNATTASIFFATANSNRWQIGPSGHIEPMVTASFDIGATAGKVRDVWVSRDIYSAGGTQAVLRTSAAITSGAGAGAGTITDAPAAGNPTKWIPINDNGTTRYFPAW